MRGKGVCGVSKNNRRPHAHGLLQRLFPLVLATAITVALGLATLGCSSATDDQTAAPETAEGAPTASAEDEAGQSADAQTESGSDAQSDGQSDPAESASAGDSAPEPTAAPQLADFVDGVETLEAGEQVQDAQGNLVSVYGVRAWPDSFEQLSDEAQAAFSFPSDVAALRDPATRLVGLDVGMCAAGVASQGFATAEFYVHDDATELLSTDPVLDREVFAETPVASPGFSVPAPGTCRRGWLPVLRSDDGLPAVARYVLVSRQSATAEPEQWVYQWQIDSTDTIEADDFFGVGQTVTFNDGRLDGTTVKVDGWAELVDVASPVDGTRRVAVSLNYCPRSTTLPTFGLAVDEWNLVEPDVGDPLLGAALETDPTGRCYTGWLQFAVPFGGVPTGFFVSDGSDPINGFAQWSLEGAALAAPQS